MSSTYENRFLHFISEYHVSDQTELFWINFIDFIKELNNTPHVNDNGCRLCVLNSLICEYVNRGGKYCFPYNHNNNTDPHYHDPNYPNHPIIDYTSITTNIGEFAEQYRKKVCSFVAQRDDDLVDLEVQYLSLEEIKEAIDHEQSIINIYEENSLHSKSLDLSPQYCETQRRDRLYITYICKENIKILNCEIQNRLMRKRDLINVNLLDNKPNIPSVIVNHIASFL